MANIDRSTERRETSSPGQQPLNAETIGLYGAALGSMATLMLTSPAARGVAKFAFRWGARALAAGCAIRLARDAAHAYQANALIPSIPATFELNGARVRAAIAAARSDGDISDLERLRIEDLMRELGVDGGQRDEMRAAMASGVELDRFTPAATSPAHARLIYASAVSVIDAASAIKRPFLRRLSNALNIPEDIAEAIEINIRRLHRAAV